MERQTKIEPQEIRVPDVRFLRGQDGKPERLLKSRLIESFIRFTSIRRAYLAQISAGDRFGVALCISNIGGADHGMATQIGLIFASIFGAHEHLDILFLSDTQEAALDRVCSPFFSAPAGR